jgi:AcrR family transcriptional regulator
MSIREQKKQATARQICSVARELFLAKGYQQTSVEEIAQSAGISRASLFNYYRGKSAILAGLSAELQPRLVQLVEHYQAKSLGTADTLQQLFAYTAKILEQTSELTRLLLLQGNGEDFPDLRRAFHGWVLSGQRRGEVRLDLDAVELSQMVYLGFIASLLGWCRDEATPLSVQLERRSQALAVILNVG